MVGIGSVCRRPHTTEVDHVVHSLTNRGLRLHTFGAKVLGLSRYRDVIVPVTRWRGASPDATNPAALPGTAPSPTACVSPWPGTPAS
ncbi:deazapurine DNA modification protein DpdA family protein [Actinokineospora pegani]